MAKKTEESFGERIRRLREKQGISMEAFSRDTGYPEEYLTDIEAGKIPPPVAVVLQLSRFFNVDVDEVQGTGGKEATRKRTTSHKKRVASYAYKSLTKTEDKKHLRAYRVTIENQGQETVQLLSRHWMITNARGELNEVKGPGVVGEQPMLKPGESYEYTSGAPLNTPTGMMGGAYQMESESGERFDIEIPTFSLDRPNQDVLLN